MNMAQSGCERVTLKRQIGLLKSITIIFGLIVGTGIYIAPKGVLIAANSPGMTIIIWVVSGAINVFGALTFAELGTTIPKFGERYAYLKEMYNPFAAYMFLWMYFTLFRPGANAIKCLTFGKYLLKPFYLDCPIPEEAVKMVAVCMAVVVIFVNCVTVKWSTRGQNVFVAISLFTLLLLIVSAVVYLATQGDAHYLSDPFDGTANNFGDIILALYSGIFSYGGWTAMNFLIEEMKNPARTLPRAIIASIALVTILYVLINVAYLGVLSKDAILRSEAVAVTLAQVTLGGFSYMVPVLIGLATIGSLNSGILVGSRLCFAGAREGHFPDVLALINVKYSTPITSLIFHGLLVIAMICAVDIYTLLNYVIFFNKLFDFVTVTGMIIMRVRRPDMQRPIKFPLVIPIVYMVTTIILVIVPLFTKTRSTLFGLLLYLGTSIPFYLFFVSWKKKPQSLRRYGAAFTRNTQRLLLCTKQEGEDGS